MYWLKTWNKKGGHKTWSERRSFMYSLATFLSYGRSPPFLLAFSSYLSYVHHDSRPIAFSIRRTSIPSGSSVTLLLTAVLISHSVILLWEENNNTHQCHRALNPGAQGRQYWVSSKSNSYWPGLAISLPRTWKARQERRFRPLRIHRGENLVRYLSVFVGWWVDHSTLENKRNQNSPLPLQKKCPNNVAFGKDLTDNSSSSTHALPIRISSQKKKEKRKFEKGKGYRRNQGGQKSSETTNKPGPNHASLATICRKFPNVSLPQVQYHEASRQATVTAIRSAAQSYPIFCLHLAEESAHKEVGENMHSRDFTSNLLCLDLVHPFEHSFIWPAGCTHLTCS